jgi:hypothetical protein
MRMEIAIFEEWMGADPGLLPWKGNPDRRDLRREARGFGKPGGCG